MKKYLVLSSLLALGACGTLSRIIDGPPSHQPTSAVHHKAVYDPDAVVHNDEAVARHDQLRHDADDRAAAKHKADADQHAVVKHDADVAKHDAQVQHDKDVADKHDADHNAQMQHDKDVADHDAQVQHDKDVAPK